MYWSLACSTCVWAWETGRLSATPARNRCCASASASVARSTLDRGRVDELGRGLDVEDGVADVGVDLLDLVGEAVLGLVVVGVGDVLLAAGRGDLQDGRFHLAGGGVGGVRVAGRGAEVAEVAGDAGAREAGRRRRPFCRLRRLRPARWQRRGPCGS